MAANFRFRQKEMTACSTRPRGVCRKAKTGRIKKAFAVLVLCVFSQVALAKEQACRDIQSSSARLACYDLASPPKAQPPAVIDGDPSKPAYRDPFIDEDAKTTAKLKNICRGC